MPTELTAEQVAARLNTAGTLGMPRVMTTVATPPDADGWFPVSARGWHDR